MNVNLIKSRRKTISIHIDEFGFITVKAPVNLSNDKIFDFVKSKEKWINKHQNEKSSIANKYQEVISKKKGLIYGEIVDYTNDFIKNLKQIAIKYLPQRLKYLAEVYGFIYNDVKIKNYKSRWGACDKYKNIYLNYKLVMIDKELIDYVILHELCHTKYFNHNKDFHKLLSNYFTHEKLLRDKLKKFCFVNKINY